MGIVVLIFMVLGVLHQSRIRWLSLGEFVQNPSISKFIGVGLLLAGLWNLLWFGLRHLDVFWGIAAIVSGFCMIMTAVVVLSECGGPSLSSNSVVKKITLGAKSLLTLWLLGLFASAILYGITIVRLNLGLPIIA